MVVVEEEEEEEEEGGGDKEADYRSCFDGRLRRSGNGEEGAGKRYSFAFPLLYLISD